MQVLLAGGTGVLGRRAVPLLLGEGHDVIAVSRSAESDERLRTTGATPVRLDLFDGEAVSRAAEGADVIVNLATAIPASPFPPSRWATNDRLRRDASAAMAVAATRVGARFVQESFAPAYADRGSEWITEDAPLDPVDQVRTVVAAESSAQRVTAAGGTGVVLRFGLFVDAASAMVRQIVERAGRGRLLLPGPGERYTSMIHVDDAAAAVVAALALPAGAYNVVEDEPMTVAEHAAVLADLLRRPRVRPLPALLGRLPYVRVLGRSQRMSNAKLRAASEWRPQHPSGREAWSQVLAELGIPR